MRLVRQLGVVGVLLAACGAPSRGPSSAARLFVGEESFVDDGPFRVVFAGPKGELQDARDVTIAFSRPLRAPGVQVEGIAPALVRRVHDGAAVAGSWRWFGERTAVFWPIDGFELATEYEVSVDQGLRAFDGSSLASSSPFRFFSTRPVLTSATYVWDEESDQPTVSVELNQAVTADALRAALRIEGKGPGGLVSVPFRVVPQAPQETLEEAAEGDERFSLVADHALVSLTDVVVVAAPSLRAAHGHLASEREVRLPLLDVGPLQIRISCGSSYGGEQEHLAASASARCPPEAGGVSIAFSKPVAESQLPHYVRLPKPHRVPAAGRDFTSDLSLDGLLSFEPGKKYRIVVKAGLLATDGERLAADRVLEVEMADYLPRRDLRDVRGGYGAAYGIVMEAARTALKLRFDVMNVPSLDVATARIEQQQLLALLGQRELSLEAVRALPGAQLSNLALRAKRNQEASVSVDLPGRRAAGDAGLFVIGTTGGGLSSEVQLISVTDLGLTCKWSPQGGLVWVTRLSTGTAVENARVALFDGEREVYAAATDADGVAAIPQQVAEPLTRDGVPPLAVVQAGSDVAFTRMPQSWARRSRGVALIFPERRLYRPGETLHVKGIFRGPSSRGLVAPAGKPVLLEATDSEGQVLFATRASLDAFGGFASEVPIPRDVRLGSGQLRARSGTEPPAPAGRGRFQERWDAYAHFSIDEFRAVEMQLEAQAVRRAYVAGERAELRVQGKYLFGAPLHDMPVSLRATRSLTSFWPPALRHFESDPSQYWARTAPSELVKTELRLDQNGSARPGVQLDLPQQIATERVSVETSIADVSGAFEVTGDTSFLVHPAEIYVGLRLASDAQPERGKPFTVEVAASGWGEGPLQAGVPVHVELWPSLEGDVALGHCDVVTTTSAVSCPFTAAAKGGRYWLIATGKDGAGRAARAAVRFEVPDDPIPELIPLSPKVVAPPKWVPPPKAAKPEPAPPSFEQACGLPDQDSEQLWLKGYSWDKPLTAGETLRTCLRGAGLALLTQEREGILDREMLHLVAPGTLHDLSIAPLHHPNFNLELHGVRGRQLPFPRPGKDDRGPPYSFSRGEALRVVRPPEKELRVAIETGAEHRPGEEIDVRVRVMDGRDRAAMAQVTLWAVDEGVVLLEPFHVPAASELFAEERESTVATNDTRDWLLSEREGHSHRTAAPKVRMGATNASSPSHIGRQVFRPTAFFLPQLITGPDGVAHARVKLPDNLTTWRVFAVASDTAEGFGEAESTFVTNKPLFARPGLPRFLRAGDRFDASVTIDSMLQRAQTVKVDLRADGALSGSGDKSVHVPANGHVPVSFSVLASGRGKAHVRFRVTSSKGVVDEITLPKEVSTPTTLETLVVSGETRRRRDEPLGDLSLARSDVGGLEYRLSSTPLIGLAESLQQLVDYPYGCTEQLSSRLVPLLRLRHLARELDVQLPRDVDGSVRDAVQGLLAHQRSDGSFGFWRESAGEGWLTVGALRALHESRRAGFTVPQAALDQATRWLDTKTSEDAPSAALLEDLLASLGQARPEKLRALAADLRLPTFARAALAHGLAKVDRELAKQVLDSVASQARPTGGSAIVPETSALGRRQYLSSDARTTALVLAAFIAVDPRAPLVAPLIHGLLGLRRAGRWATTQESAWALMALDDARAALTPLGASGTSRLLLGGDEIARVQGNQVKTGLIPMSKLLASPGAALSFSSGGAPLYFETRLRYSRVEPPKTPLEHGIHVARAFKVGPESPGVSLQRLRVGDRLDVEVVLGSATPRELVVLEDPIPAGFEAVNQDFANDDRRRRRGDSYTHRELRDDRVLTFFDRLPAGLTTLRYPLRVIAAGRFSHPPAKAECMYEPDVFGRTAAGSVETR